MKPQSLSTRARIQDRQDNALRAIERQREREGREDYIVQSYGGPELPVIEIHKRYDAMLVGLIGKA